MQMKSRVFQPGPLSTIKRVASTLLANHQAAAPFEQEGYASFTFNRLTTNSSTTFKFKREHSALGQKEELGYLKQTVSNPPLPEVCGKSGSKRMSWENVLRYHEGFGRARACPHLSDIPSGNLSNRAPLIYLQTWVSRLNAPEMPIKT